MQKQVADLMKSLSKNQRLSKFAISDRGFLFDPETGQSFTLNATGLVAMNHLKNGETIEETAKHLADEFKVPHETAVNSVEAFLIQLGRYI